MVECRTMQLQHADGYCRVSTPKQVKFGHALERYIEDLEFIGIDRSRIFWDVESGASSGRKGYNLILDRVIAGITKQVFVPCFDRFLRSPLLWEEALVEFRKHGATLELLSGGLIDLNSPEGIYKSRIDAAAAAYVREKNQKAALDGWARTRRLQKAVNPPFGIKVIDDKYYVNREPYPKGGSVYEVARDVGLTYISDGTKRGTIHKLVQKYGLERVGQRNGDDFTRDRNKLTIWLRNPVIRGYTCYFGNRGKQIIVSPEPTHEALFTPLEFDQIDRLLTASSRKLVPKGTLKPLSGLVFCECGSRCIKRRNHYYCCDVYDAPGSPLDCDRRGGLSIKEAEAAVIYAISLQSKMIAAFVDSPKTTQDTPEQEELKRKLILLGDDADFEESRQSILKKLSVLRHQAGSREKDFNIRREQLVTIGANPDFWNGLIETDRRFVFLQLIERVVKSRDRILRIDLAPGLGSVTF